MSKSAAADKKVASSLPVEKDKYVLSELTTHVRKFSPEAFNALPPIPSYTFAKLPYIDEDGALQEDELLKVGWNSFRNNTNPAWALATADEVKFYKESPKSPNAPLVLMSKRDGNVDPNQLRLDVPFDYIRNLKEPGGNKLRHQLRKDKRKRRDIFIQYIFLVTGRLDAISNTMKEYTNVLGFFTKACEDIFLKNRQTVKVNSRKGSEKDPIEQETNEEDTIEEDTIEVQGNGDEQHAGSPNGDEQHAGSPNDSEITAAPTLAPVPTKRRGGEKRKRTAKAEANDQEEVPKAKRKFANLVTTVKCNLLTWITGPAKLAPEKLTVKLKGIKSKSPVSRSTTSFFQARMPNTTTMQATKLLTSGFQAIESAVQDLTTKLDDTKTENEGLQSENEDLREIISHLKTELVEAKRAASEADDDEMADVKLELVEAEQTAKDAVKEAQEWKDKYEKIKITFQAFQTAAKDVE
jgi:regulator of replication initiation timing